MILLKKKKLAKGLLLAGMCSLLLGLILLFVTDSLMLGITFLISILFNTAGITLLTDPKEKS